jgi:hypothetical protein
VTRQAMSSADDTGLYQFSLKGTERVMAAPQADTETEKEPNYLL